MWSQVLKEVPNLPLQARSSLPSTPTSAANFFLICPNCSRRKWKSIDPLSFKYTLLKNNHGYYYDYFRDGWFGWWYVNNRLRMKEDYKSLDEFYPFYLSQHSNRTCRRLHVIGTFFSLLQLLRTILFSFNLTNLFLVLLIGYGFAWVGHYIFEKNKPATFKYPRLSFLGDLRLFKETITGARAFWSGKWSSMPHISLIVRE